jgi:hypothetical protein
MIKFFQNHGAYEVLGKPFAKPICSQLETIYDINSLKGVGNAFHTQRRLLTVEIRCGGLGSGVPARFAVSFRTVMKPYLSTSPPLMSSQSSRPPANSCSILIELALPVVRALLGRRQSFILGLLLFSLRLDPVNSFQVIGEEY